MKVLIIGCGSIGRRHISNIRTLFKEREDVDILAYRTFIRSGHLNENFFRNNNVRQFSSLTEALSKKPDVTFITNPTSLHVPFAIKAARAGSHLFIEKPLSHNLKGINELEHLVAQKKLITYIGFNLRFFPILSEVRRIIKKKEIGRIISIRAEVGQYLPSWHPNENYRTGYSANRSLGGGVILDLIHEIDYTRWLLGEEIKEVFCYGGKYSSLNIDTEDIAEILMKSKSSVVSIHLDYLQSPMFRQCKIIGDKKTIIIDVPANFAKVHAPSGSFVEISPGSFFEKNISFLDEIRYFFECVEENTPTDIDIREGAKILKIALAAKESMRKGKPIKITKR